MTYEEAQVIGATKMKVSPSRLKDAMNAAREMKIEPEHMPPVALAMAFMQKAGAFQDPREVQGEFTDALALVSQAESEWRMEQVIGAKGRLT